MNRQKEDLTHNLILIIVVNSVCTIISGQWHGGQGHGLRNFTMCYSAFLNVAFSKILSSVIGSNKILNEPAHEISNNVICETSKAPDQPAHTRSLIRTFASGLSIP